ncbi:MAG: T9SS type A sorting domain-containing protein [Bacteroidetes bacterium]|nr:MAG: T9SS type A sorting domain-containing protein [Bacteroidota bacterium]
MKERVIDLTAVVRLRINVPIAIGMGVRIFLISCLTSHLSIASAQSWNALGTTGTGCCVVNGLSLGNGKLYAGGSFTDAGGVAANGVAQWNGSAWSALGLPFSDGVFWSLCRGSSSDLYAGGSFTTPDGALSANRVAKWNGSAWSALGSGMDNGIVTALCWDGSNLYAGGSFTLIGGVAVNRIAKWDGSAWSALGSGMNGQVFALAWDGSNLYAGGSFNTADGVAAPFIAKYDGSAWSDVGGGTSSSVNALAWDGSGNNLYVGGAFNLAGGIADTKRVAKWNGSAWNPLATGIYTTVNALAWDGSNLYAGGSFSNAGGAPNRVAKWDGSAWNTVGFGVSGTVYALAVNSSCLYAGGAFVNVCGNAACSSGNWAVNYVATWGGASCVTPLPIELLSFTGECIATPSLPEGDEEAVKLQWSTANETNNNYFTVECSLSFGEGWGEVGRVQGAGNSSAIRNYEFSDVSPLSFGEGPGVRYYRLKQTDYDGNYEYFGPVSVECGAGSEWDLIFQNIFQEEELKGTLLLPDDEPVNIVIMDLQGRIISREKIHAKRGSNLLKIDLSFIARGTYFIKAESIKKSVTKKIVKF